LSLSIESAPGLHPHFLPAVIAPAHSQVIHTDSLIIGGGPAGLAPLIAASRDNTLARILARGVIVAEQGPAIGPGRIGGYAINSDSSANTLLSCILENPNPQFATLRAHPAVQAVAAHGQGAMPLAGLGAVLGLIGGVLRDMMDASPGCAVLLGHTALQTTQTPEGLWRTQFRRQADGAIVTVLSRLVVLATGGHQPESELRRYRLGGVPLGKRYQAKILQSNEALTRAGLARIARRLAAGRSRRVAIIGSSSSALASAHAMLSLKGAAVDQVTVLHRRPLRVFYASGPQALADGYTDFGPDDICPISGYVFRFAGFRLESRELVMSALRIGGRVPDPRLRLHRLEAGPDMQARAILEESDVIIAALGYRPRALPVADAAGCEIKLQANGPGKHALVDSQCRVLDAAGAAIPGLLGIGLAAGFIARGTSGGEPSFTGQSNGLWQWQNEVGLRIARELAVAVEQESKRSLF